MEVSKRMSATRIEKKKKIILIAAGLTLLLAAAVFSIVNIIIANSVISSMADVRIEKNDASLEEFGLTGEQIQVLSADGISINAYIVPNENSKGNILLLHGMHGMDATSLFDYANFLYDAGYTPIPVDMRAHGKSGGSSLSFGYNEVFDVIAVIDYLKSDPRFRDQPIIIYGLSMGGSTAINTSAKSGMVDAVIAVSPFLSIQNQVADYMRRDGAPGWFVAVFQPYVNVVLWQKFNSAPLKDSPSYTVRNMQNIPLLIIHGDADTQTHFYHSQALFDTSSSTKRDIWVVKGKDHLIVDDILSSESKEYRERITTFLDVNFSR